MSQIVVGKKTVWQQMKEHKWCYIFIFPSAVMFFGFALWPLMANWYFSLFDWNGIGWPSSFVGLKNYQELFADFFFWNSFKNTFIFSVGQTAVKLPLALFLAVLLNNPTLMGRSFYRAVYFLPVVTTTAIVGIVMTFILNPFSGTANNLLMALGLTNRPIEFLSVNLAMVVIILVEAWKMTGQYMIYWLAGLQAIPGELYEAATVDGASKVQTFWAITLPLLKPVGAVILLFGFVYSLRVFDIVMVMTGGGPNYATDVMATYIYRHAFAGDNTLPRIGFASAAGVVFSTTLIVIAIGQRIVSTRVKRGE